MTYLFISLYNKKSTLEKELNDVSAVVSEFADSVSFTAVSDDAGGSFITLLNVSHYFTKINFPKW
jgi:hypothetical protein